MEIAKPTQEAAKRRLQDSLVIIGSGILVFGAWSLIKVILLIYTQDTATQSHFFGLDQEEVPVYVMYLAVGIIAFFDLVSRIFVCISARAEGFGRRKGYVYLVIAGFMALLSTLSVITSATALAALDASFFERIVTLTIEATSVFILVLLIVNSIRLKLLTRKAAQETE